VISRCVERIGDHAVDIGEQVMYLVTGEYRVAEVPAPPAS
jgi:phosphate uptake regulator